jgi:hypothetical protein
MLEKVCHDPIRKELEKKEIEEVIDRVEKDIELMRESSEAVHYYSDDKDQLANDLESLIYAYLVETKSPRVMKYLENKS